MPGFWKHKWRLISFTLAVDNFGVKYVGEKYQTHLLTMLRKFYVLNKNEKGDKYCGITLDWDYVKKQVHLSMPGYCSEALQQFRHNCRKVQDQSHHHTIPTYGAAVPYAK